MGYDYYNHISPKAKVKEVREFLSLLGYQPVERGQGDIDKSLWWYYYFKDDDYESFTGITAVIGLSDGKNTVVNLHTKILL